MYGCPNCARYFAETFGTALAGLRTPLSRIQQIFDALNVRPQFTTKRVPAVALGIVSAAFTIADLFRIHFLFPVN